MIRKEADKRRVQTYTYLLLTVMLYRVRDPWNDLHGRVIDKCDDEEEDVAAFLFLLSPTTSSSSVVDSSTKVKSSTSTILTLCNAIANMLYSDGNDLESTISKIVSGRLLLVVVSCWLDEDGCLISLVNDSFPLI